jgi:hypothetical protein
MKTLKVRVFLLAVLILGWSALFFGQSSKDKPRDVYVIWRAFVLTVQKGGEDSIVVQTFLKQCADTKTDPTFYYDVRTIKNLEDAEGEFRQAADQLKELRLRMEHPYEARK